MKAGIALVVMAGLVAGGMFYFGPDWGAPRPQGYRTVKVKRGDLNPTISATGTLEPEEVVDVGAQVAGKIYALGHDPRHADKPVDYGSTVESGTELAYIDDAVYQAQVDQAQASQQKAQADLQQAQVMRELAEQEVNRADRLRSSQAVAESEYDQLAAKSKVAKVNVSLAEAALKQTEAALRLAKTNLGYTVIKSPVRGVILDRRVNVGQTVVASLNAPSLFLIAKDLRRMQVWASVNEADIGRIQPGVAVRFTVDAFPKLAFRGNVEQVRLNASMTQNVVTYTVVILTDNADGKLLPYLTANVQFAVEQRHDVLLVPNGALRWRPSSEPSERSEAPESRPSESPGASSAAKAAADPAEQGRLWIKQGQQIRPVDVQVGATDGIFTEVRGADVREGLEVVVGEERPRERRDDGATASPFTPKMPR